MADLQKRPRLHSPPRCPFRLSAFRPRCDLTRPCKRIRENRDHFGIISARPREQMWRKICTASSPSHFLSNVVKVACLIISWPKDVAMVQIYVFFRLTPLPSLAAKWTATTWPRRRPSSPRPPAAWGASRSGWARGTRRTPSSATPSGTAGMSIDCQISKQSVKMCQIIV